MWQNGTRRVSTKSRRSVWCMVNNKCFATKIVAPSCPTLRVVLGKRDQVIHLTYCIVFSDPNSRYQNWDKVAQYLHLALKLSVIWNLHYSTQTVSSWLNSAKYWSHLPLVKFSSSHCSCHTHPHFESHYSIELNMIKGRFAMREACCGQDEAQIFFADQMGVWDLSWDAMA